MKLALRKSYLDFDMKNKSEENQVLYKAKIWRRIENDLKAGIYVYANILKEV